MTKKEDLMLNHTDLLNNIGQAGFSSTTSSIECVSLSALWLFIFLAREMSIQVASALGKTVGTINFVKSTKLPSETSALKPVSLRTFA